jgi:hypothetical protein
MEGGKNLDPLGLGIAVHKGLEHLFRDGTLDSAMEGIDLAMAEFFPKTETDAHLLAEWDELLHLARGLLIGWRRTHHDLFLRQYEILSVEKEIETPLSSNLILLGRPDLVVRDRTMGGIEGINLKTTSSLYDWTTNWLYDIQAWTEALAIAKDVGEPVKAFRYIGFWKGAKRDGHYSSPLIYGYRDNDPLLPSYYDRYRAGREKFPTWRQSFAWGEGLSAWISWLPEEKVAEQFAISNPIFINDAIVEPWLSQVVRWETDAQHINDEGSEEDKLAFFEQRFSKWNCKGCSFEQVCFKKTELKELVKSGALVPRDSPIVKLERDMLLETTT